MKTAFYYCSGCFTIHIIYIYFQSQEPGTFLGPKPVFFVFFCFAEAEKQCFSSWRRPGHPCQTGYAGCCS
jgi:hypothetical protein